VVQLLAGVLEAHLVRARLQARELKAVVLGGERGGLRGQLGVAGLARHRELALGAELREARALALAALGLVV
jgi:hypothetical protein